MSTASVGSLARKDKRSFGVRFESLASWLSNAPITLVVIVASVVAFFSGTLSSAWQLGQSDLAASWWRLMSCHLTHWSFDQLFWDVLAFGVLGYLCEQTGRLRLLAMLLLSSFAVSASVLLLHPELTSYRGLSGVDSALFAYLACYIAESGYRNSDRTWLLGGVAAWLVFVGKVAFELCTGQTLFVEAAGDFQSLPISHVAGALAGSVVWLVATVVPEDQRRIVPFSISRRGAGMLQFFGLGLLAFCLCVPHRLLKLQPCR